MFEKLSALRSSGTARSAPDRLPQEERASEPGRTIFEPLVQAIAAAVLLGTFCAALALFSA